MGEKEEKGEITMEELYESLKAAAIINCFEKEFGPVPHPLRFFKFRRWVDDFEIFLKGVPFGEKLAREMNSQVVRKAEKKRIIEVMEGNE